MEIKFTYLIILFSILMSLDNLTAQNCPQFPIILISQQQIDDFATFYPGCTEFDVDITIESSNSDEIQNLEGLIQIKKINGNLSILDSDDILSLSGLDSLKSVHNFNLVDNIKLFDLTPLAKLSNCQELIIDRNTDIQTLAGLGSLEHLSKLSIVKNFKLTNLVGLNKLKSISGDLSIIDNIFLEELSGIDSLKSVGQSLIIESNDNLLYMKGLKGLTEIGGDFKIRNNPLLRNAFGATNLKSINRNLIINGNSSLINLEGLDALISIKNDLLIINNQALIDLKGLESLESVQNDLKISNNKNLDNLTGINNINFIGNELYIASNENFNSFKGLNIPAELTGLERLTIYNNLGLESLEGLEMFLLNIPTISISQNQNLSHCAVQSICTYIAKCKFIFLDRNSSSQCNNIAKMRSSCASDSDINFQLDCISQPYPNPVSNILNIQFSNTFQPDDIEYEVIDMQNRLLMEGKENDGMIDVSKLMAGVYCLRIKAEAQTRIFRFVKN